MVHIVPTCGGSVREISSCGNTRFWAIWKLKQALRNTEAVYVKLKFVISLRKKMVITHQPFTSQRLEPTASGVVSSSTSPGAVEGLGSLAGPPLRQQQGPDLDQLPNRVGISVRA